MVAKGCGFALLWLEQGLSTVAVLFVIGGNYLYTLPPKGWFINCVTHLKQPWYADYVIHWPAAKQHYVRSDCTKRGFRFLLFIVTVACCDHMQEGSGVETDGSTSSHRLKSRQEVLLMQSPPIRSIQPMWVCVFSMQYFPTTLVSIALSTCNFYRASCS